MAIVTTNNQNYIDIADAIRAKGVSGTFKPSEMASAIVSIPAGGSSGNGVHFIDYDGRMVEEWSADSVDSKTALPNNPTHEGLIGQGWNWSLENIKSYISKYPESNVYVGQMYKTASGFSEFDITLTKVTGLTVEFSMEGNKNWGDGTSDDDTSHTYADYGDYTIACDGEDITSLTPDIIRRVRVGENVISIGEGAFYFCPFLSSITIPDSVTSIGEEAFACCYSLFSIIIPDSITSIGNGVLNSCEFLSSIAIPDSVVSIGAYAFNGKSLSSITIPDGVTSIGEEAFASCPIPSITIPDSVTNIDYGAFFECYSLTSITIPDSITSIGDDVFNSCPISSITIPDSIVSISGGCFSRCMSLSSITIPDGVTSIGDYAFAFCSSLKSIAIPNGVTSIGDGAFSDCYACIRYDFSQATSVPTLSSTDVFVEIRAIAKIIVPDTLYDEWIAAENWSTYADYIYKASEITD